jgi:FtsP/CotA-like multicopper oxidase with cupredoxin domain
MIKNTGLTPLSVHIYDNEKEITEFMNWRIVFNLKNQVMRIRFAPIGGGIYPFSSHTGPGYVWHNHILDHEDNEMMRPCLVT